MPTISTRTAKDLLAFLDDGPGFISSERSIAAIESLRLALKPRPSPRRKAKTSKQRANTSAVYEAVKERAGGRCECCGAEFGRWLTRPELDHARGRANAPETAENTWLLMNCCHTRKHNGPAVEWLEKYLRHSVKHGHVAEARWAEGRIQWVTTKAGGAPCNAVLRGRAWRHVRFPVAIREAEALR